MTDRISRESALMKTAYVWASQSTCSRLNVGVVIHREGRILVQGYNGAPAGLPHCNHDCECGWDPESERAKLGAGHKLWCPSTQPCTRAVHAEQNAIAFAARHGVKLEGAEMMVTHQPCLSCAMSIVNAGISFVGYQEPYRLPEGIGLLMEAGIEVAGGLWPQSNL